VRLSLDGWWLAGMLRGMRASEVFKSEYPISNTECRTRKEKTAVGVFVGTAYDFCECGITMKSVKKRMKNVKEGKEKR
jgi:hypothetical protein